MKKLYEYLFYRAYDLLSVTGNYDLAWSASHFLSLYFSLLIINFTIRCGILQHIKMDYIKIGIAVVFLGIHLINYFIFLSRGRYKNILLNYADESREKKNFGRGATILFTAILVYSLF